MGKKWLTIIFALIIILPVVIAADNILDSVLAPIGNLDLAKTYLKYPALIDSAIYLIFFIGLSKMGFSRIPSMRDNKLVPVMIGIILAISMAVFSYTRKISLVRDLGPYAIIIFLSVIFVFLYNLLRGMGVRGILAFAIPFLLLTVLFNIYLSDDISNSGSRATASPAYQSIAQQPLLKSAMGIGQIVSILAIIFGFVSMIKKKTSGESGLQSAGEDFDIGNRKVDTLLDDEKKTIPNALQNEQDIKKDSQQLKDDENAELTEEGKESQDALRVSSLLQTIQKTLNDAIQQDNRRKGISDDNAMPLEQKIPILDQLERWLVNASQWFSNAFLNLERSLNNELEERKTKLETEEKIAEQKFKKIIESDSELQSEVKLIESDIKGLDSKIFAKIEPEILNVKKDLSSDMDILSNHNTKISSDIRNIDGIDNSMIKSTKSILAILNNESSYSTLIIGQNTFRALTSEALTQVLKLFEELIKINADKMSLIMGLDSAFKERINHQDKMVYNLENQTLNDLKKTLRDSLTSIKQELEADTAEYSGFLNNVKSLQGNVENAWKISKSKVDKASNIIEATKDMLNSQIMQPNNNQQAISDNANQVLNKLRDALIRSRQATTGKAPETLRDRVGRVVTALQNICTKEQQKINKINQYISV